MKLTGIVCDGSSKSSKWMFKENFLDWYPGTLNIKLEKPKPDNIYYHLSTMTKRGTCKVSNVKINGVDAQLMWHVSAKLDNTYAEIGHQQKLRDLLNLQNGDTVTVEFTLNG